MPPQQPLTLLPYTIRTHRQRFADSQSGFRNRVHALAQTHTVRAPNSDGYLNSTAIRFHPSATPSSRTRLPAITTHAAVGTGSLAFVTGSDPICSAPSERGARAAASARAFALLREMASPYRLFDPTSRTLLRTSDATIDPAKEVPIVGSNLLTGALVGTESWRKAPRRVWGWSMYLEIPEPKESVALREAAEAIVAGKTPYEVARQWNARRDLPTVHGGPWSGLTVEKILRRATNTAGSRPLLTHAIYEAMLALLDAPDRREVWKQRTAKAPSGKVGLGRYLFTGVAHCPCGAPMVTAGRKNGIDFVRCGRRPDREVGDPERHPTTVRNVLDTAISIAAAQVLAEQTRATLADAEKRFRAMTLLERRAFAARHLDVVVVPTKGRGRGTFTINPKKSVQP